MNLDEIKLSDNRFLLLLKTRVKGSDFFVSLKLKTEIRRC